MNNERTEKNIYKIVTMQILDSMMGCSIPWRNVLLPKKSEKPLYRNYFKGNGYSLLNTLLLGEPGCYATWNQIKDHGGSVKQGAKSRIVTFWAPFIPKDKKEEAKKLEAEGKSIDHLKMQMLKYYRVFNMKDVEGITLEPEEEPTVLQSRAEDPTDIADMVINDYCHNESVTLQDSTSDESFYDAADDSINVPNKERFCLEEDWFASVFAGLVHSTAQKNRCNRETEMKKIQDGEISPKEELTAEIGSSMILTTCGLKRNETHQQLAAECQKWVDAMNKDYRLIVYASSAAEKAAQYILGNFAES